MRVVFAGTPAFAASALGSLIDARHDVALVLTQPDRPAGRGLKLVASEVKRLAEQHRIPVFQPETLKSPEAQERIAAAGAETMVVAAYGLILPRAVLDLFAFGCINIHASLLPRWRGAAPIQRALLAGDRETGISIMRMEKGLDAGPVYLVEPLPITEYDTAGSLHDKLAAAGAHCIVQALRRIASGTLQPVPQPEAGVTYAQKIAKEEAALDWLGDAVDLDRRVRAFNPFPGAYTHLRGEVVKIWGATPKSDMHGEPGAILEVGTQAIVVACGKGALCVNELQRAGGKRLCAADFLRGAALGAGERFGV